MSNMNRSLLPEYREEVVTKTTTQLTANNSTSTVVHTQELAEQQGDTITQKQPKTFRIGFININRVTYTARNPKNTHIKQIVQTYEFDHIGIAETNCNWYKMTEEDRWHERARKLWKKSKSVLAHNRRDISKEIKQPGGVLNLTVGNAISSTTEVGKDELLGRWAWTTFKGKAQIHTTIITGY